MHSETVDQLDRPAGRKHATVGLTDFTIGANPRRPPGVAGVFESSLAVARKRPSDDYLGFRAAAAEQLGCEAREVLPCSGEFAGVRLLFDLLIEEGDSILTQTPGCENFPHESRLQGATPVQKPHESLLDADPTEHDAAVLCHPNPSAGPRYETDDLLRFIERCRAADTIVVVDETYLPFTNQTTLAGVDGVVVVRSMGEAYGLPGLRIGVVVATGTLRDRLETTRISWGLSVPGAAVGEHCLRQKTFLEESRARIAEERERLRQRLSKRYQVSADGNFLRIESEEPTAIAAKVRKKGLLVSDGTDRIGCEDRVVFAQRAPVENDRLLDALGV